MSGKRIASDATLRALQPREKEYLLPDKKVEGLNIRVRPSGVMTWVFRYQVGRRHEKITLGRYERGNPSAGVTLEQARVEASRYRGWLENGKCPKEELVRERRDRDEAKTFDDAFQSYREKHLRKQLRGGQSQEIYRRDIQPILGKVKLADLHISDLNKVFCAKIDDNGKPKAGAISACYRVINQVIHHALAHNMILAHPAPQLKAKDVGGGTKVTKRNLNFTELKLLLMSLDRWRTHETNIRLFRFLLGCGQRVSAVRQMRWDEVDLDQGLWHIPPSSEERQTKSQEPRRVPLSDYLLTLLRAQRETVPGRWKQVWPQLAEDKALEASAIRSFINRNRPEEVAHFSPHDLRRTFISRCNELRLDIIAIEKAVGHQLPGMLKVYNHHEYLEEQREVLNAWGEKLQALIEANVVPMEISRKEAR